MSRARSLAQILGSDGALNVADLAGLAAVASSGAYADLSGKPTLAAVAGSGAYSDLSGKPALAAVATSGAYSDLSGKPSLFSGSAADLSGTLPNARLAAGTVLQYAQAVKTDTFSGNSTGPTSFTAIPGLSATITPRSTSSKILIMTTINYDSTRGNSGGGFAIFRNGSFLDGAAGQAAGSEYRVFGDFGANANADQSGMSRSFQVIDAPATASAVTYDIRFCQDSTSFTTHINRGRADITSNTDDGRFASSILLLEIAG